MTFPFLMDGGDGELLIKDFHILQLSFQMWTDQMQQSLESKKKGDSSFKQKDFKSAIERYTQVGFSFIACLMRPTCSAASIDVS